MPFCIAPLIHPHADRSFTSTQDVARLQPALSALPARPSPNQGPPLLHPRQLPLQYSQGMSYQTAQGTGNSRPWSQQAWQGQATWGRPIGHTQLNQVRCFLTLQLPACHKLGAFPTTSYAVTDCTSVDSDAIGALPRLHTLLDRGVANLKARAYQSGCRLFSCWCGGVAA